MSSDTPPDEVTRLLQSAEESDSAEQLLELVYDQLRKIAQQRMAEERVGHTLQATALVHEAYLRLTGNTEVSWQGRAHFFAAAAEAMRRILIDRARRKAGPKQGGNLRRVDLDQIDIADEDKSLELLSLDEALCELERHDAQAAKLVKLRYFAGMAHQEAAEALGIGRRTADRLWTVARAWLYQHMTDR
jgi:RNA polymerase sigma factor (TIGR02999 family)